jgi:hypothetical protein
VSHQRERQAFCHNPWRQQAEQLYEQRGIVMDEKTVSAA